MSVIIPPEPFNYYERNLGLNNLLVIQKSTLSFKFEWNQSFWSFVGQKLTETEVEKISDPQWKRFPGHTNYVCQSYWQNNQDVSVNFN